MNAPNDQCDKAASLRLDGHALDKLLPFRIVLDRSLRIVELGPSIRKLCPAILLGEELSKHFRIMRPSADARWEEIASRRCELFLLATIPDGHILRGQFIVDGEQLLFWGTLWVQSASDLARTGLEVSDYAVHDPMLDLLKVMDSQRLATEMATSFAREASEQRAMLSRVNARLKTVFEVSRFFDKDLNDNNLVECLGAFGRGHEAHHVWLWLAPMNGDRKPTYSWTQEGRSPITEYEGPPFLELSSVVQKRFEHLSGVHHLLPLELESGEVGVLGVELNTESSAGLREAFYQFAKGLIRHLNRHRTHQELVHARNEAEQATAMKSTFLAAMSHEVRTPLNAVIGLMDLLMEGKLDEEQREYIVLAQGAGKDLLRIVSDILDFSKVEAGQLELESIQFDIFALVNRIVKQLRPGVTKKGIELTVAYADGVSRWCTGDPIRVGQILNNLLSNAIKFTEKGSVQLRVSRRLEMLRFDVTDSGLGIDENAIKRLFQPFRQADESTTRKYGGTGLGLAIAKALTHRMNGEIGAQSESGKGSTFWFCVRLPACTEVDDAPEPVSLRDVVKIQIQPTEMHARPILVAEDNPVNRRLMRGFLQQLSFRVVEVETGDAAIEEYKKGTAFAAILMDWQMPGCDGITATERIRTIEKMDRREHVPIIGLSANALAGDREQCMGAGMDEYLTKPIRFDVLRTVLKRWVRDSERPAAATSLDLKALHAALGMDDDDFGLAKEVIGIFLDSSTSNIDLMSRYVAENEMLELAKQAHTLKGSSSNIAANALARLSADLEKMARRGDGLGASRLFGQLRKEYEQVRIDCQRYLRGETPAPET